MNWSTKRQLIYFFSVFGSIALILGIIAWAFFFSSDPTCFDGRRNGQELGVDCGGVCEVQCTEFMQPLRVNWANSSRVSENVYNAVAMVENRNPGATIESIRYRFTLYDREGDITATREGITEIPPGESFPVIATQIVSDEEPVSTFFEFLDSDPVWRDRVPPVSSSQLRVQGVTFDRLEVAPRVMAELSNSSLDSAYDVGVVVLLYDSQDTLVGSSRTIVDRVGALDTEAIVFTWPTAFSAEIDRFETFTFTTAYQI